MFPVASTLVGLAFHTKSMIIFRVKALRVGVTFKISSTGFLMPEEIFSSLQKTNQFLCVVLKNH